MLTARELFSCFCKNPANCERIFSEFVEHVEGFKDDTSPRYLDLLINDLVKDLIKNGCSLIEKK